jgi:hypothetical protein
MVPIAFKDESEPRKLNQSRRDEVLTLLRTIMFAETECDARTSIYTFTISGGRDRCDAADAYKKGGSWNFAAESMSVCSTGSDLLATPSLRATVVSTMLTVEGDGTPYRLHHRQFRLCDERRQRPAARPEFCQSQAERKTWWRSLPNVRPAGHLVPDSAARLPILGIGPLPCALFEKHARVRIEGTERDIPCKLPTGRAPPPSARSAKLQSEEEGNARTVAVAGGS